MVMIMGELFYQIYMDLFHETVKATGYLLSYIPYSVVSQIDGVQEQRKYQRSLSPETNYYKLERYFYDSLGGVDNIACYKKYKSGVEIVLYDFELSNCYHLKNFDMRVFVSEKRGCVRLLPLKDGNVNSFIAQHVPLTIG